MKIDSRSYAGQSHRLLAILAFGTFAACSVAIAQSESAQALRQKSAIVLTGKVVKAGASDEPMVAASSSTVVVAVEKMHAGSEIAGDQTGKNVTVILSRPERLKVGEEAMFFGNPRFSGQSLTIADEGEIPSANGTAEAAKLEQDAQAARDRPLAEQVAAATLVFRGVVEAVHPLASASNAAKPSTELRSEHEPDWQVASIRVTTPMRGTEAGKVVTMIFPASTDIVWFHAPKLKQAQDAVFIAHAPTKDETKHSRSAAVAAYLDKQPAYLLTQATDVLPSADESRVRALVKPTKEKTP